MWKTDIALLFLFVEESDDEHNRVELNGGNYFAVARGNKRMEYYKYTQAAVQMHRVLRPDCPLLQQKLEIQPAPHPSHLNIR